MNARTTDHDDQTRFLVDHNSITIIIIITAASNGRTNNNNKQ